MPASSQALNLSVPAVPSDDDDDDAGEIKAIWGTNVNINETMRVFREFMRGFKVKYRIAYDRERGRRTRVLSSPEEGEVLLYEQYLRRMRQTDQRILNLDMDNLASYPPSRKLQVLLVKYPQEVVPMMDQVLKDLMIEIAEEDQQAGMDGMRGADGEEEIATIMNRVYNIRPFGVPPVNMRDLNPSGTYWRHHLPLSSSLTPHRYGETRLHQGPCYPRNTGHPRYEGRLLPLPHMQPHRSGRNRAWQDRRACTLPARCLWYPGLHVPRPQSLRVRRPTSHPPARDTRRCSGRPNAAYGLAERVRRAGRRREARRPARHHRHLPEHGCARQPAPAYTEEPVPNVHRRRSCSPGHRRPARVR